MTFSELINLIITQIEKSTLLSTIIGTITGGLVTWVATTSSLNKQFKHQNELMIKEEKNKKKTALISVRNEIANNVIYLILVAKSVEDNKMVNHTKEKLQNNKWKVHSDIILMIDNEGLISRLGRFYFNLEIEMVRENSTKDNVTCISEDGEEVIKILNNELEKYN